MNNEVIELEKKEMIAESIPLLENFSKDPSQTSFDFSIERGTTAVWLTLKVMVDGEVFIEKERKLEQLNG